MKNLIFAVLAIFILSGCSFLGDKAKPSASVSQPILRTPDGKFIKGTINRITPKNGGYFYTILVKEKGKIQANSGFSKESGFNIGDLVYAQIQNGEIIYMSLIIKNFSAPTPSKTAPAKRRDTRSNIAVPKEEKLSF